MHVTGYLNVVTTTSDEYATAFDFTEEEVFKAMDDQGIPEEEKENVKFWYDGDFIKRRKFSAFQHLRRLCRRRCKGYRYSHWLQQG